MGASKWLLDATIAGFLKQEHMNPCCLNKEKLHTPTNFKGYTSPAIWDPESTEESKW